jgi:hypothetical protein
MCNAAALTLARAALDAALKGQGMPSGAPDGTPFNPNAEQTQAPEVLRRENIQPLPPTLMRGGKRHGSAKSARFYQGAAFLDVPKEDSLV